MNPSKPETPLSRLIARRRSDLDLSEDDLLIKLGYANLDKGRRRLAAFGEAKGLKGMEHLEKPLARALDVCPEEVGMAVRGTIEVARARADREYAEAFSPHAIYRTERTVPSQITLAALCGADRNRVLRFDAGSSPLTYPKQVVAKIPDRLPFFERELGLWINYTPDHAVEFDRRGTPIGETDRAIRIGTSGLIGLDSL